MPREPNTVRTVQVTVSTTPQIRSYLDRLARTGLYGKNAAEAAERLIAEQIRERVDSGKLPPIEEIEAENDSDS